MGAITLQISAAQPMKMNLSVEECSRRVVHKSEARWGHGLETIRKEKSRSDVSERDQLNQIIT